MSDEEMREELAGQSVISFATVPDCEAWFVERRPPRLLAQDWEDGRGRDGQLRRGPRGRSRSRLDRRAEAGIRREILVAALHPARAAEQVVADQPGQGRGADRGRSHAP